MITMAIISNETSHDRNFAFTDNNNLISTVREIEPTIENSTFGEIAALVNSDLVITFNRFVFILLI